MHNLFILFLLYVLYTYNEKIMHCRELLVIFES